MGSKHKAEKNSNPGPGQYEKSVNSKITQGKIGSTKRADLWGAEKSRLNATPGPGHQDGTYTSFGNTKGGNKAFGNGRKEVYNNNPGPGQYSENDRIKSAGQNNSVRIGTTARPDIWEE